MALTLGFNGQIKFGGVTSFTVTKKLHVDTLLLTSATEIVTVWAEPGETVEPIVGNWL